MKTSEDLFYKQSFASLYIYTYINSLQLIKFDTWVIAIKNDLANRFNLVY